MVPRNWQFYLIYHKYVWAGDLRSFGYFTNGLKFLKVQKIDIQALIAKMSFEGVKERLVEIIQEWGEQSKVKSKSVGLQFDTAINPLNGIGVPFPYTSIRRGVTPFR
ncbi:hypothetical protein B9Z19DRAFT_1123635 [Tuber borchii]|uniref:Uncharacterized protein n=1 Tax=Tuber borchii TaxID=42251 RepID=A0A2T6ZY24_TUBBO|nr:hypothetical protein B9Z19DRAFT_1123635 [Tuber borchii]